MGDSLFSELKKGGFIMLPYNVIKLLGVRTASVLCQIVAEHNYAKKNRLNLNDDFLFSPSRMASYLCMGQEDLEKIFDELETFGFIDVYDSDIADTMYMRVYPQAIINFKQDVEQGQLMGTWDLGLKRSQNPIHKPTHFCPSLESIKEYLDEHMAEPEIIPLIEYSYANAVIMQFEEKTGLNVYENLNLPTTLDMIVKSDAPRELFEIFINKFKNT